jgi:uroporphyrinogen-III synthase
MRRLIVLRPEPGASETVERARTRGLDAVAVPLFAVEPVAWHVPDASDFDGLLLTSANAVRCAGPRLQRLRALPVHAVGETTAEASRAAGLTVASTGDGGVDALLAAIDPDLKLLHLCGEHRRTPTGARQPITSVTVYRSKEREAPLELAEAAGSVVLAHSPRAASRFAELADRRGLDRSTIRLAAISTAAAEASGGGWAAIAVADTPTDDALLALAEQLCDKARRG